MHKQERDFVCEHPGCERSFARKHDLKMHLDGARIWHVAAETGLSISELCAPFDSVSLCLSKGLGACFMQHHTP